MKKVLGFLMSNPITSALATLITYAFYGCVIGICMVPSIYLITFVNSQIDLVGIKEYAIFGITLGLAVYLYFIISLLVFGVLERILTLGFKPGRYKTNSLTFVRWLIYSGLHVILLNTTMPFVAGTFWGQLFYKILGAKIGKNVFINTKGLHDAYLLTIEDNVVIGGDANISCHTFEGNTLTLGKITIRKNTLVCAEAYIMPGADIGENCNIGIKSYVRKNRKVEDKSIIMAIPGIPAKKVAEIIKEEKVK